MYTFELAADKETKISCPSLLAADIKSTEDLPKSPLQQSEKPSGWVTPFSTSYPSLSPRSSQTGSQIPNFPQSQNIPNKPNQVPKEFDPSFFYSYFYPYFANPENTPTKPLHIPIPTEPAYTQKAGKNFNFPINQLPAFLPIWSPVTKSPPANHEIDHRPYQFNISPKLPQKSTEPRSSYPKDQERRHPDQFSYTQTSPQTHSYPLYLEKLPEKPGMLHPTVSEKLQAEENLPVHLICTQQTSASKLAGASQGQVSQPFYLLCTQLRLALKNTASQQPHPKIPQGQEYQPFFLSCTQNTQASKPMSQPSHPESAQGQKYLTFYLLCTLLRQSSQPTGVTWPLQHEALQTYQYQAFFPYYAQSQPTSKPGDLTQPSQPITPQDQVYHQIFSSFTRSKSTLKSKPQQPAIPQGQSFQQFFQFFPQPQPTLNPSDITQPPLPNTSPSKVYKHLLDYFSQLQQTQNPAQNPAVTPAPKPANPQGQSYQSLLDYLTQQRQTPKPHVTQAPQPATHEAQIYQPIFHFRTPLKQNPKSAAAHPPLHATLQGQVHLPLFHYFSLKPTQKYAVTPPPKPATPQGQAYQPLLDYVTQLKSTSKPAVTQPLQPSTPQSQRSFHFSTKSKLTPIPTVSEPSQLDISQGHVNQPFSHMQNPELQLTSKPSDPLPESSHSQMYQLLYPYQLYTHPKSVKEPTFVPQPSQPTILQGEAHQMCLYNQLLTESQLAKMPTEIILGKVYGPCQLSWKPGAETSSLKPDAHVHPAHCSQFCPSRHSNCCLQIAFHQHLHISTGQDGKDVPHIYNSQPFSQAVYPDFSRGLEGGQIPQKLSEAAILQSLKAPMAAHISPHWPHWATGQNQEYFLPPDGNPAAQPRSSSIKTAKQSPVYPYFAADSSNPHSTFLPQHSEVPNLEQRKAEGFKDPSELWASGVKRLEPVEQRELVDINFPQQQNSQVLAEHTHSRPNFMSYINQRGSHTAEQPSKSDTEQSLHKSEFESSTHHNLKRAMDHFFSAHYMPQDAPNSNGNLSEALDNYQTHLSSNNSTKSEQAMNSDAIPQSYVLLQHGPPNRKPISFSDDSDLRNLGHSPNSKMQILNGHQSANRNLKLLEESQFKSPEDEASNPFLDDADYMLRMDDKLDLPSFSSTLDDTGLVYLPPEQYFSAAEFKPEVLDSFEDLWKSLTRSDSSQSFAAQVPNKRTSAADQIV